MSLYYQTKLGKLYCGDCLSILKTIVPSPSIALTITSPPYDTLRRNEGQRFDFKKIAGELFRVTENGGVCVWIVGDSVRGGSETGTSFKQALHFIDIGFNLHDTMIYGKSSYMPLTHNRYEQAFEYMLVLSKGKPNTFNPIMVLCQTKGTTRNRYCSKQQEKTYAARKRREITTVKKWKRHPNIFFYHVGRNDKTQHNSPFPEKLVRDHIISWSNEEDIILDPMCGSGTTCKIAEELNRRWIGIEIIEKHCEEAAKRLVKGDSV